MRNARGGNRARHDESQHKNHMIGAIAMLIGAWIAAAVSNDSITGPVIAIFLVIAAAVIVAQKFGWLPSGSLAKAAQERADFAQRELDLAVQENHLLQARIRDLETRTDLQPLLEGQQRNAEAIREMTAATREQTLAIRELARRGLVP